MDTATDFIFMRSVYSSVSHCPDHLLLMLLFLHVSEAGSPAADVTSDSGLDHLPPASRQSAQCSAVRGGPAGRRSHPEGREIEQLRD